MSFGPRGNGKNFVRLTPKFRSPSSLPPEKMASSPFPRMTRSRARSNRDPELHGVESNPASDEDNEFPIELEIFKEASDVDEAKLVEVVKKLNRRGTDRSWDFLPKEDLERLKRVCWSNLGFVLGYKKAGLDSRP